MLASAQTILTIDQRLQNWLSIRQELMVLYCKLGSLRPFDNTWVSSLIKTQLDEFCQLLVDYVACGHFSSFPNLISAIESCSQPAITPPTGFLTALSATTHELLDFHDKYLTPSHLDDLCADLSELGETLAERLEWEDKLINKYQLAGGTLVLSEKH